MMKNSKKAQMEIMGLAVIVILLAIGMFFLVKFSTQGTKQTEAQTLQQRGIAMGFVNTLLNTNSGCSDVTFTKLLEEMADEDTTTLNCAGYDSLNVYFEDKASFILSNTLESWGYKYNLSVTMPDGTELPPIESGCAGSTNIESSPPFPIPVDAGDVTVIMRICY